MFELGALCSSLADEKAMLEMSRWSGRCFYWRVFSNRTSRMSTLMWKDNLCLGRVVWHSAGKSQRVVIVRPVKEDGSVWGIADKVVTRLEKGFERSRDALSACFPSRWYLFQLWRYANRNRYVANLPLEFPAALGPIPLGDRNFSEVAFMKGPPGLFTMGVRELSLQCSGSQRTPSLPLLTMFTYSVLWKTWC